MDNKDNIPNEDNILISGSSESHRRKLAAEHRNVEVLFVSFVGNKISCKILYNHLQATVNRAFKTTF